MNKKIKCLAEQYGLPVSREAGVTVSSEQVLNFAKALVLEAVNKKIPMRICGYTDDQNHPYYKGYQLGYYDGLVDLSNAIKKHFGLEEVSFKNGPENDLSKKNKKTSKKKDVK